MADLFDKPEDKPAEEQPVVETPQTITLGDKEYSQEELSKLVGLGETASELESKWNTKIDRLYPEYTKSTQELAELRKEKEAQEAAQLNQKVEAGEQLSPEELKKRAQAEADSLGILTEANAMQFFARYRASEKMGEEVLSTIAANKAEGKPETDQETLLRHMEVTGIKIPQKAYNDLFEKEIDDWKQTKLDSIKKPGMVTDASSNAGSHNPSAVRPTRENLDQLLNEALTRE